MVPLALKRVSSYDDADINSCKQVVSPAEEEDVPAEEVDSPAEEVDSPAEEVDAPVEEVDAPAEEVDAPAEKVDAPAEKVDAAAEEVNYLTANSWDDEMNARPKNATACYDFGDEIEYQDSSPEIKKKEQECKEREKQIALLESAIENGTEEDQKDFISHLEKIQQEQEQEQKQEQENENYLLVQKKSRSPVNTTYYSLTEDECLPNYQYREYYKNCNICYGRHHAYDCPFKHVYCKMNNGKNLHGIMKKCEHGPNCNRKRFGCVFNHCPKERPSRLELKQYILRHTSEFTSERNGITKEDVIRAVKGDDILTGEFSLN